MYWYHTLRTVWAPDVVSVIVLLVRLEVCVVKMRVGKERVWFLF